MRRRFDEPRSGIGKVYGRKTRQPLRIETERHSTELNFGIGHAYGHKKITIFSKSSESDKRRSVIDRYTFRRTRPRVRER